MGAIVFDLPAHSTAAAEQRFQRHLKPLLLLAVEEPFAKRTVYIKNGELYICDVAIGKWRYIANFRLDNINNLLFDYKDTVRIVDFGLIGFEKRDGVKAIFEKTSDNGVRCVSDVRSCKGKD